MRLALPFAIASLQNSKAAYGSYMTTRNALAASFTCATRYGRSVLWCRNHRSRERLVCTDQTYHQEQHPDRTFHGLFS